MTRQVLPTNVRPTHYDVTLTPDLENFTFTGSETVRITINEATKTIVLNVHEVKVKTAQLTDATMKTEKSQNCIDISHNTDKQQVTLTFPQELAAGRTADLYMEFTGELNDKMCGFYRSSYTDESGTRHLATTQFEPTDARRAFPCWDEPAIKATFDITLVVPKDKTTLSNMDVISETSVDGGKKAVKFATTPMMSTYLVAFVVGDFAYLEDFTTGVHNGGKRVRVRVYTLKGLVEQGRHSLNVATQTLEYFAQVFAIPYPLPKLDMIAVPDFEAGAMENWGLVTYRTTAILYDPKASDLRYKQRIAYTVAHELAHQWFGNLVTMEWWDHLWLNEGFATWVGYLAVDKIFPEWDIWTQYVTDGLQRGMSLDSLRSSHPIEVPVNDPSEIHQIFDAISYYKGASVIRMLSAYLNVDTFLKGVRRYLKRHEYGNASTDDLWKALTEESGIDVGEFMRGWTRKVGYPVLTVTESSNKIHVRQTRFLLSGSPKPEEDETVWWVPLSITTGANTSNECRSAVLTDKKADFSLPAGTDFYKLNVNQTNVFRVNYSPERLAKLAKSIKAGGLDTSDRCGLISDAGALASSGYGKTSTLLSLVKEFENEDTFIVWSEVSGRVNELLSVWYEQPEPIYEALQKLLRDLVCKLAHKMGWEYPENEDYLTSMLRTLVIKMAGRAGDPETVAEAHRRFKLYTKNKDESAVHRNIRGAVYEIVLTHGGGKEELDAILDIYRSCKTADQKMLALTGLGFVQQPELIQRVLEFSVSEEVRNQDIIYPFSSLEFNRKSRKLLWEFIKKNWSMLHERYAKSLSLLAYIVKNGIESLTSEEDIANAEAFFKDKDTKDVARPLEQSLESARLNAAWLTRDRGDVEQWLLSNGYL